MKNKKRTLLLSLSCALAFVIALCGFNAYANSNLDAVTSGSDTSVASPLVEQQQYQRNNNGLKIVSSNGSTTDLGKLYPAVYDDLEIETITTDSTIKNYCVWKNMNGAVDDIVCVKNVANEAIYVRTVFAFEAGNAFDISDLQKNLLINKNNNDSLWTWSEVNSLVDIGGQNYYILCATYNGSLAEGSISSPSLYQIALANSVTKDFYRSLGDKYEVKVTSQAVVVDDSVGTDVAAVLNTVFGEIKVEDHPWKK